MFIVYYYFLAPLFGTIIIISGEFFQIWLYRAVLNPPVEIYDFRSVLIYNFTAAAQPVLKYSSDGAGLENKS